jgi:hypothetical protein
MRSAGLDPDGAGARCILLAGARTRDIVRLARKCVDRAGANPRVDTPAVDAAYAEIIDEEADSTQRWWSQLSRVQQKVMRAVAASSQGLTTAATRQRFALAGGLFGAMASSRLLTALLFETKASDAPTLVAVLILLVSVAVVSSYLPARRAAKTDPMLAMRAD